jgi:hypothetical protein
MPKTKTRLPPTTTVKRRLWTTSAGRCQLEGCNVQLSLNPRTKTYMNRGYIAHIYGAEEGGPRSEHDLNPEQLRDFDNLMMLCDACHRNIDRDAVDDYPADRLLAAKKKHLEDIARLTNYASAPRTQILLYGSKVGKHDAPLNFRDTSAAVLSTYQPNDSSAIEINVKGLSLEDDRATYWRVQLEHLETEFTNKVHSLRNTGRPTHYSVFTLAPQPLMIKLGILLGELVDVTCYQRNREPESWGWRDTKQTATHIIQQTRRGGGEVALKLSLSAEITDERITRVLGDDCSIWNLTHAAPSNDYLRSAADLSDFRTTLRRAFSEIKLNHGEDSVICLFPAGPVTTMVETGRVWMPKADLPLKIYDQNHKTGGFAEAIFINPKSN